MTSFAVKGHYHTIVAGLFGTDDTGHLTFGWSVRSVRPATVEDLLDGSPIKFRDHIMEGMISYSLVAKAVDSGMLLQVEEGGANRDKYIIPQIGHYIKAAGFELECENGK